MDAALKQRLVGASVIIALAVIFIPMVFDDSALKQNQEISIEIPNEPEGLKHKVFTLDSSAPSQSDTQKEPLDQIIDKKTNDKPIVKTQESIIELVDNTKKVAKELTPKNVKEILIEKPIKKVKDIIAEDTKTKEKPNKSNTVKELVSNMESTYRIVYGSFSQQKNAQQLKAKIINSGNNAIVEKDNKTQLYKVFSRQYTSKRAVEDIVKVIQTQKLNIGKPSIQTLSSDESQAAELQLDTGWVIQIGSFSSKVNSLKLRNKIRKKGYVCFVDEVLNSKKQLRYRVRVGPYATRKEAQSAGKKLEKQMKLKGLIKPHEKEKVVK